MPCYLHNIEQLITSEIAELVVYGGEENAGCTFNTSRSRDLSTFVCVLLLPEQSRSQSLPLPLTLLLINAAAAAASLRIKSEN